MSSFYLSKNHFKSLKCFYALLFILFTSVIHAKSAENQDSSINITADTQDIDLEKNTITFIGNVILTQNELTLKADKIIASEIKNKASQSITAYGAPLHFEIINQTNSQQNVKGQAKELVYLIGDNDLILTGDVQFFQQENHIQSDRVTYSLDTKIIKAYADKGKRVKTTLIPNQIGDNKNKW